MIVFPNRRDLPLTVSFLLIGLTQSFLFPKDAVNPFLNSYAQAQKDILLSFGLDISQILSDNPHGTVNLHTDPGSHLYISDIQLKLSMDPPITNHVALPGANGPNPLTSTGPHKVEIISEGYFVSMNGRQNVSLEKGCWEMVWVGDQPAGSIICGFQVTNEIKRNAAKLPAERIYVHFPIWTKEGLQKLREEKKQHEDLYFKYKDEQDDELKKMNDTNNPLFKALHFRNACAANEKRSFVPVNRYKVVPVTDNDVVSMGDGLLLCNKGTVWTKDKEVFLGPKKHSLLGYALAKRQEEMVKT